MRRIETKTKGKITDANGKSFDGFVEGNPKAGVEATHLSDSWCNNLQEEICNVIEGVGGQIVSGSDVQVEKYDQMFQAIKLLVDTATPIGSVKAMPIKMSDSYMARWVPIDEDEAGRLLDTGRVAYLSKEMAKNCEKVEGDKAGWYKLVTGNKENGEASGAFGWALADGTFPLPISSFGEDDGTRPETEEEKNKRERILSDTEYGKMKENYIFTMGNGQTHKFGRDDNRGWRAFVMSNIYGTKSESDLMGEGDAAPPPSTSRDQYFLEDKDLIPPKDDTPIDLGIWTTKKTKKPKLIPNLNDKTFLMGSNEENLPFTVEGKNGFMMQPHHMPPHRHDMSHGHESWCTSAGEHNHRVPYVKGLWDVDTPLWALSASSYWGSVSYGEAPNVIYTDTEPSHNHTITVDNEEKYSHMTGGYYIYKGFHREGGDMENKGIYGAVPIDLRPKRLAVYYYIRVI